MQCNCLEINAPSPTNTTNFTLNVPDSGFTVGQRGNQVVFDCYWQGSVITTSQKNFAYILVSSNPASPTTWDDEAQRQNFVAFVVVNQGTYALVEKY